MNAIVFGVGTNLSFIPAPGLFPEVVLAFPMGGVAFAGLLPVALVALVAVGDVVRSRRERLSAVAAAPGAAWA